MTKEEFEKWIEYNNYKTIYSFNKKYNYLNTNKFDFAIVCAHGCDGMYGCFKKDSKWELISYEPNIGDRPQRYLRLSSNKKFDKEEDALDELKNKLNSWFNSYNECFICHSRFLIDTRNIPSNQKTFYYKCPNCDAELKIGNPNYKDELVNREKLIKTMKLPNNIRALSEEEKNKILCETLTNVSEFLKEIQYDYTEYELSKRQQATKNNAINDIKRETFLDAYFEIADFVDDYGDCHNGVIYGLERYELNKLINSLYQKIIATTDLTRKINNLVDEIICELNKRNVNSNMQYLINIFKHAKEKIETGKIEDLEVEDAPKIEDTPRIYLEESSDYKSILFKKMDELVSLLYPWYKGKKLEVHQNVR